MQKLYKPFLPKIAFSIKLRSFLHKVIKLYLTRCLEKNWDATDVGTHLGGGNIGKHRYSPPVTEVYSEDGGAVRLPDIQKK